VSEEIEVQVEMDALDREILNQLQSSFPLVSRPYLAVAEKVGCSEEEVMARLKRLHQAEVLRQTSAIFDTRSLGYKSTLVAMRFAPDKVDQGAEVINTHPGVSHNYLRNHEYNLWFTIAVAAEVNLQTEIYGLGEKAGAEETLILPTLRLFKIGVNFDMTKKAGTDKDEVAPQERKVVNFRGLTEIDKAAVRVMQEDLAIEPEPFKPWAAALGWSEEQMFAWFKGMVEKKFARRFASIIRHRKAGFSSNGMAVWKVPAERMNEVGPVLAGYKAVTHCYKRPTFPTWPYNLFTMIHAETPQECMQVVDSMMKETGLSEYKILYSDKEYKKVRLRYFMEGRENAAGV
jgi:DNA-binding Lrp family transcriptional regulator